MHPDERIIPLSRVKLVLLVIVSFLLVGLGVWLRSLDPTAAGIPRPFANPVVIQVVAWSCIGFFSLCGLYAFAKLFDKKPGLIFSSSGITDNSSGIAAGLIPWGDIEGFSVHEIQGHRMLVVLLKDPEKYIERGSALRRSVNRTNHNMSGSPIAVGSNGLRISFDDLQTVANEYFARYGNRG